jgi:hypothetical protein
MFNEGIYGNCSAFRRQISKLRSPAGSLQDLLVKSHHLPGSMIGLVVDLHDPAKINPEVPAAVHWQSQDVTCCYADQTLVANNDTILSIMLFPLLFQEFSNSSACLLARFSFRKPEVLLSLTKGLPDVRIRLLYFLFCHFLEYYVIHLIQALIHNRGNVQLIGNVFDRLPGA